MSPRIVLTRPLPPTASAMLAEVGDVVAPEGVEPLSREALLSLVAGADAIVSQLYDVIDAEILAAADGRLRLVANVAAGYDNIDVAAAEARGVAVTNTPGVLTDATADITVGLILMVMRRLGEGERLLRRGDDWSWDLEFMLGTSLRGRTLGVVGFGQIGRAVAVRAKAFGMQVVRASARPGAAPSPDGAPADVAELSLEQLLAAADVVSLHCPLTPHTRHLINAERLGLMRPGSYLVNTARGAIVDETALVQALRAGHIAGAALDVFEHEPRVTPELLELENVVAVPHLGSATREVRDAMAELAASNVVACLAGRALPTPVSVPRAAGAVAGRGAR
jgi:glyoxylate reductase